MAAFAVDQITEDFVSAHLANWFFLLLVMRWGFDKFDAVIGRNVGSFEQL